MPHDGAPIVNALATNEYIDEAVFSARPSAKAVYTRDSDEIPERATRKSISGFTGPWRYGAA